MSTIQELIALFFPLVLSLLTSALAPAVTAVSEVATVNRVIDGDTIVVSLDGVEERVRYIGIDTPEVAREGRADECGAVEATQYNEILVLGKTVTLERDVSDRDRFDRLLRYVYVGDDLVQESLLEAGHASVIKIKPDVQRYDSFRAVERTARSVPVGMWKTCI